MIRVIPKRPPVEALCIQYMTSFSIVFGTQRFVQQSPIVGEVSSVKYSFFSKQL